MHDLHLSREITNEEIVSVATAFYRIRPKDVFITDHAEEARDLYPGTKLWINKIKRHCGDFRMTAQFYPQLKLKEYKEIDLIRFVCGELKLRIAFDTGELSYPEWIEMDEDGNQRIFYEDLSYDSETLKKLRYKDEEL